MGGRGLEAVASSGPSETETELWGKDLGDPLYSAKVLI